MKHTHLRCFTLSDLFLSHRAFEGRRLIVFRMSGRTTSHEEERHISGIARRPPAPGLLRHQDVLSSVLCSRPRDGMLATGWTKASNATREGRLGHDQRRRRRSARRRKEVRDEGRGRSLDDGRPPRGKENLASARRLASRGQEGGFRCLFFCRENARRHAHAKSLRPRPRESRESSESREREIRESIPRSRERTPRGRERIPRER